MKYSDSASQQQKKIHVPAKYEQVSKLTCRHSVVRLQDHPSKGQEVLEGGDTDPGGSPQSLGPEWPSLEKAVNP